MTDSNNAPGPLAGLRVLELGEMVAAPFCAKLLGDLGADVIKVERPAGDPSRALGPFPDDTHDRECSALFLYLNTSKRSIRLDLDLPADQERFAALAAGVDILIEDRAPGSLEAAGLGFTQLAAANPKLVVTSITPYGQSGPNAQHRLQHLNLYHAAGHTSPFAGIDPDHNRAPACAGGYVGEYDAGLTAALGTLGAIFARNRTGRGQHIDASKQEAMMCLERVTIGRYANEPDPFGGGRGPGGLSQAKDGWVMLTTLETHQWDGLVRAMGDPTWAHEPWCETPAARMENMDRVREHVDQWAATLDREEIYHRAQAEGTPAAPVRNVAEVMAWKQLQARGFFRSIDHPKAGSVEMPTAAYQFSKTDWVGYRAPLLGEHDAEILGSLDTSEARADARPAAETEPSSDPTQRPLSGVRIADFTWAWAGPQASLLLGMLGAEVVKIESRARLDHARVHSLTAGSLEGGIDGSPVFNDLNLGKRSVTLNLKTEGGRGLVRDLVAKSDVVLQNMRPGVLDRMGLGYASLEQTKSDIIMLSSSAVGAGGPEGSYAGYAPTFACLSGVVSLSGHPDEPPISLSGSVDLRVGTASAFAVLAALVHRQQTGEGQNIDLSSTEVMSSMIGDALVGTALNKQVPERRGNRDASMAPHGCYACRGEGEWLTIAVGSEAEWEGLRAAVTDPRLDDESFSTASLRHQNQNELDAIVSEWTRSRAAIDAVDVLQQAGVPSAPMQTGASLARDPHVLAREVYQTITHPRLGELRVVRPPWRLEGAQVIEPSPLLGQHNDYVLGGLLGIDRSELDRLIEEEIVY